MWLVANVFLKACSLYIFEWTLCAVGITVVKFISFQNTVRNGKGISTLCSLFPQKSTWSILFTSWSWTSATTRATCSALNLLSSNEHAKFTPASEHKIFLSKRKMIEPWTARYICSIVNIYAIWINIQKSTEYQNRVMQIPK